MPSVIISCFLSVIVVNINFIDLGSLLCEMNTNCSTIQPVVIFMSCDIFH